jgi:hypothetical protein
MNRGGRFTSFRGSRGRGGDGFRGRGAPRGRYPSSSTMYFSDRAHPTSYRGGGGGGRGRGARTPPPPGRARPSDSGSLASPGARRERISGPAGSPSPPPAYAAKLASFVQLPSGSRGVGGGLGGAVERSWPGEKKPRRGSPSGASPARPRRSISPPPRQSFGASGGPRNRSR